MRKYAFIILLLFITINTRAQTPYNNFVFDAAIKSVAFYNAAKEGSFPIITLKSNEQVQLAFDDLRGGRRNYSYTLEHCDSQWNPSNINISDYLQGFREDRITDYAYSTSTVQKYTHYEVKLPNDNIIPKIAGNYVLKVYEDSEPTKILLTRRLYIMAGKVTIAADVVASSNVSLRPTNQKLNITVSYAGMQLQNPNSDIRVLVMQNERNETAQLNIQPTYVRGNQLVYNDVNIFDFAGRNEFRHFDTRTFKLRSDHVGQVYRDTAYTVVLLGDPNRNLPNYSFLYDNDGRFYILNQDGTNPRRDADYAHIYFTLAANKTPAEGNAYVVGKFNDYRIDNRSKMDYDPTKGRFFTEQFLKQGVYDYVYVWVDKSGKASDVPLEGSYFETENEYQVLVYYRPPNARWEELVGYRMLVTQKK